MIPQSLLSLAGFVVIDIAIVFLTLRESYNGNYSAKRQEITLSIGSICFCFVSFWVAGSVMTFFIAGAMALGSLPKDLHYQGVIHHLFGWILPSLTVISVWYLWNVFCTAEPMGWSANESYNEGNL